MSMVVALFWSLVHSIWQGGVLHAGAWLVTWRSRSASQRYLLLCAAQLGLVVAFVSTLLHELDVGSGAPSGEWTPAHGASSWLPGLMLGSVAAWGAGLALMTARMAGALRGVVRLRNSAAPLPGWQPALERATARLGLRRAVAIVEAAVDTPLTLGWLRPVVLMPLGWAAQLPPHVVEAAILHELVHVKRHDYLINIAQHVVEALFFYHPSVWWLSRRVRAERELSCDQAVVDSHLDPLEYAAALLALERQRGLDRTVTVSELGLAAARGELSARVEHVLSRHPAQLVDRRRGLGVAVAALALVAAASLGACLVSTDDTGEVGLPETSEGGQGAAQVLAAPVGPRWLPASVSRHGAAIEAAAAAHRVDPALLSLVVLVESGGDPNAQSPGGALGLMQVMPATAATIAAGRGLPAPTAAQLREPAFSLDFGAYLLARLLAPAVGTPSAEQVRLAAIGYNGGPGALRAHLEGRALWRETERYSWLLSQLWTERDADSSATYQALAAQ